MEQFILVTKIDRDHGPPFDYYSLWSWCRFGCPLEQNLFPTTTKFISVVRPISTIVNCNSKFPLVRQIWRSAVGAWCCQKTLFQSSCSHTPAYQLSEGRTSLVQFWFALNKLLPPLLCSFFLCNNGFTFATLLFTIRQHSCSCWWWVRKWRRISLDDWFGCWWEAVWRGCYYALATLFYIIQESHHPLAKKRRVYNGGGGAFMWRRISGVAKEFIVEH